MKVVKTNDKKTPIIDPINQHPTAKASISEYEICIGDGVRFFGDQSFDNDGKIVSYEWRDMDGIFLSDKAVFSRGFPYPATYRKTLTVTDDKGTTDSMTVILVVKVCNTPPIATPQQVTLEKDTNRTIILSGIDVDSDTLTYSVTTQPKNGTLSGTASNLTYTPNRRYYGEDSFNFKTNDGVNDSLEATVSIVVTHLNVAPVAIYQSIKTDEDNSKDIILKSVDNDGDTLSYIIVTHPSYGVLSGVGANITYTPNENYSGNDSFIFKVNDGILDSNEANVSIEVTPKAEVGCADKNVTVGEFNPVVKWHWKADNSASYPTWKNPYSAPIVIPLEDTNGDGEINSIDIPAVVFHTHLTSSGGSVLRAVSGLDGRELWTLKTPILKYATDLAAGDIDNDGLIEIIAQTNDSKLCIIENDGKIKYIGTTNIGPINSSFSI